MTNRIKVGLWITPEMKEKIKVLADKERWSMSKVTEVALEYYLKLRRSKITEE